MTRRRQGKVVREGEYFAEVEIELIDAWEGWSPSRKKPRAGAA